VRLIFTFFLACTLARCGDLVAGDWTNPPLYIVSEQVELIVGRDLTVVSGRYVFEYVEKEDLERLPRVCVHYPLYVKGDVADWREVQSRTNFDFKIGSYSFAPTSGSIVRTESLSDYPLPEDAAVAFLTFEIPRKLAEQGFEVTIRFTQPNFRYNGGRLSIHTPWLPKSMQRHPYFTLADNTFDLRLAASQGVTIHRIPTDGQVISESPTELVVVPAASQDYRGRDPGKQSALARRACRFGNEAGKTC
jgi:hypothetical protein